MACARGCLCIASEASTALRATSRFARGQRAKGMRQPLPGLFHRPPRKREIAAATRTDAVLGEAPRHALQCDRAFSGIEVVQEVSKCIHRRLQVGVGSVHVIS
jgi:hypothetical protein